MVKKLCGTINNNELETFLSAVDELFPVPLSQKQELAVFADKLAQKGTICAELSNDKIVALVAGYTDNVPNNIGYISIVATLPMFQGRGIAAMLLRQFIQIAEEKHLDAVHLYTTPCNSKAISMYRQIGFVEYFPQDEPRPYDLHLIYNIREKRAWEKKE